MIWPREFNPKARALIEQRSGGVCECCGRARATQIHHRLYKSRLGRGNPGNGVAVCGLGGAGGCHGVAHSGYLGESLGWSVRSRIDPLKVPVFRKSDRTWWVFTDDGTKDEITAEKAVGMLREVGAIRDGIDVDFQGRWSRNQ